MTFQDDRLNALKSALVEYKLVKAVELIFGLYVAHNEFEHPNRVKGCGLCMLGGPVIMEDAALDDKKVR